MAAGITGLLGTMLSATSSAQASLDHPASFYGTITSTLRLSGAGYWQNRSLLNQLSERICDQKADSLSARAQFTYAIQDIDTKVLTYFDAPEIMTVGPGAACKDFLDRFIVYRSTQASLYAVNLKYDYDGFGKSSALAWRYRTGWRYNPYVVCTACKDFEPLPEGGEVLPQG
ncbi:hypothetical protein [Kribbella sp. NPDC000426]|uniref:hypothetical protein n=1 Tax=Kribbella sp. NPDC000426 TaxID=3154255 RepID=UPI00332C48D9